MFKRLSNQIIPEEAVINDSKYDCQYVNKSWKIQIHKGIDKIAKHHLNEFSKHCRLKGGEKFRLIIEEQYNLIVLTVFKMIDWWEVLQDPMIEQLSDCSFYLNLSRLFVDDSLSRNSYYIHYVRRMRAGRKFWCIWKDVS
jgi:hypothetical protein